MSLSRTSRLACVLAGTATSVVVLAGVASAHVTVQPPTATAGGYTTLSFKVPNESDSAATVGLDVELPTETPLASVSVQPKPGWTYEVTRQKPATPLTVHGREVTEVATKITWKTANGNEGIKPGEFDTFPISTGPLPEDAESLTFKALQTYSDGEIARWIEVAAPGEEEPDRPAPTLTLTAASDDEGGNAQPAAAEAAEAGTADTATTAATGTADDSDGTARAVAIAGLAVGVVGLGVGGLAFATARRRTN